MNSTVCWNASCSIRNQRRALLARAFWEIWFIHHQHVRRQQVRSVLLGFDRLFPCKIFRQNPASQHRRAAAAAHHRIRCRVHVRSIHAKMEASVSRKDKQASNAVVLDRGEECIVVFVRIRRFSNDFEMTTKIHVQAMLAIDRRAKMEASVWMFTTTITANVPAHTTVIIFNSLTKAPSPKTNFFLHFRNQLRIEWVAQAEDWSIILDLKSCSSLLQAEFIE